MAARRPFPRFLLLSVLLGSANCFAAQQPSQQAKSPTEDRLVSLDREIDADKRKIAALEQAAKSIGGPDVDGLNSQFVDAVRAELQAKQAERAILDRIDHLEKYLAAIGPNLSQQQKAQVQKQIMELERARTACDGCTATGGNSASNAAGASVTRLVFNQDADSAQNSAARPNSHRATGTDPSKKNASSEQAGNDPNQQSPQEDTQPPTTEKPGGGTSHSQDRNAPPPSETENVPKNGGTGSNLREQPTGADNAKDQTPKDAPLYSVKGNVFSQTSGNPLNGIVVQILTEDGKNLVGTTLTDPDGYFEAKLMNAGSYQLSVSCECNLYKPIVTGKFSVSRDEKLVIPDLYMEELPVALRPANFASNQRLSRLAGGELVRVIAGFEQSGASASTSKQNFFYDMFITVPFPALQSVRSLVGPKLRLWGDIRLSSAPQNFSQPVGTFIGTFADNIGNTEVRNLARSADWLAGLEYNLISLPALLPSFDGKTKQKFSLSFLAEAGAITPLDPKDNISVFKASQDAISQFGLPSSTQFIAFTSQDRNRFFRQYSFGFRFKTHYFDLVDLPLYRFPAMLDVAYGVDESVTRGRVRGGVLKVDGFYPLPWDSVKYIYFYGTAKMKPARAKISAPLILQQAPQDTPVPGPNTQIVALPQIDRDYYRLGVGVDFISLFKTILEKNKPDKKTNQ